MWKESNKSNQVTKNWVWEETGIMWWECNRVPRSSLVIPISSLVILGRLPWGIDTGMECGELVGVNWEGWDEKSKFHVQRFTTVVAGFLNKRNEALFQAEVYCVLAWFLEIFLKGKEPLISQKSVLYSLDFFITHMRWFTFWIGTLN